MEETASLTRSCPACGAAMPQQARFCGACGADSQSSAEQQPTASELLTPEDASTSPGVAEPMAGALVAPMASVANGRACLWCGTINSREALRCVTCDAVFPKPEVDAEVERAAQERLSAMEKDLRPRSIWWPFRSR